MRVGVQSHADGAVPKSLLHDLRMHPLVQYDCRSRVPKIVKPDDRKHFRNNSLLFGLLGKLLICPFQNSFPS